MTSDTFSWAYWLTFFSLYEPELSVKLFEKSPESFWQLSNYNEADGWSGFGPLGQNLILFGGTIVFFAVACRIFQRRDIPQPL
jgi:hypothetical protein